MKSFKKVIIPTAFLALALLVGTIITAGANGLLGNSPGSADDPIVTKSYVDQRLAELGHGSSSGSTPSGGSVLAVVELRAGQTLIAFEGTEFIVRNGKAVSTSQTSDGIPNLTTGQDLKSGAAIPNNHLLLFPRNDERGIRHDDASTVVVNVMVRGAYEHRDGDGAVIARR